MPIFCRSFWCFFLWVTSSSQIWKKRKKIYLWNHHSQNLRSSNPWIVDPLFKSCSLWVQLWQQTRLQPCAMWYKFDHLSVFLISHLSLFFVRTSPTKKLFAASVPGSQSCSLWAQAQQQALYRLQVFAMQRRAHRRAHALEEKGGQSTLTDSHLQMSNPLSWTRRFSHPRKTS